MTLGFQKQSSLRPSHVIPKISPQSRFRLMW
ncbi:hypothetical protein PSTT_06199 [Puccinia striiformis]|uniref:Uncharacterized protein n=1 Tax=Puccinia striiformis TaxID=27350 RepID=A0A2S4VLV1_9BASI|nr:hypothetical protein PSTT_06199 [Puccinia striiformis]